MLGKGLSSLIPKKEETEQPSSSISKEKDSEQIAPPLRSFEIDNSSVSAVEATLHSYSFQVRQKRKLNSERLQEIPQNLSDNTRLKRMTIGDSVFQIEVEKIKSNPYQPRSDFDEEGLKELAESIRSHGILQPLVVSKIEKETESGTEVEYQLIAGERRLKAAKLIGLERVPAIVKKVDSHRSKLEIALIENIQRSNLNSIEAARAYTRLYEEFGLTQQEIGARVGKSRESIANTMRLLKLPPHIQEALSRGQINESQARTLLAIANPQEQEKIFSTLLSQKLTIRELQRKTIKQKIANPQDVYWEKQLEEKIGLPVKVIKNGSKGKIVIQFYSENEWQNIIEKLIGPEQ